MGRFFGPLRISDDRGTPRPLFTDGGVNRYLKYRTEFGLGSQTLAVLLVFVVPMAGMALVQVSGLPVGIMIAVGPLLGIAMLFVAAQVPRRQHAESVRDFLLVGGRCAGQYRIVHRDRMATREQCVQQRIQWQAHGR